MERLKNWKLSFLFLLLISIAFTGCKPTEKNYKSAYDAAVNKRKAAETLDADMGIPGDMLQQLDGPSVKVVNGDSVYFTVEHLKLIDGENHDRHPYNVAVSAYKMKTNCAAQVNDLRSKGYDAFGLQNPEGKFYVIAGSFDSVDEAAEFIKKFMTKEKRHVYSGLPSAPVILEWR